MAINIGNANTGTFARLREGEGFYYPSRNCHGIAVGRRPNHTKPYNALLIYKEGSLDYWLIEGDEQIIYLGNVEINFMGGDLRKEED